METARIYLVRDGRLVPADRPTPLEAGLSEVIAELQEVPTATSARIGFDRAARVRRDRARHLQPGWHRNGRPVTRVPTAAPSPTEQQLAAAQLVMTLTDRGPGIGRVRFTVDGNAVSVPRGRLCASAARPVRVARRLPVPPGAEQLSAGGTAASVGQLARAKTGRSLRARKLGAPAV